MIKIKPAYLYGLTIGACTSCIPSDQWGFLLGVVLTVICVFILGDKCDE